MPRSTLASVNSEEFAGLKAYSCSTPSRVVELISRPAGTSLMSDTKFAKQSPPLYASIPGAAISSISASRKCSLTKRVVACLRARSFRASSTFPLTGD